MKATQSLSRQDVFTARASLACVLIDGLDACGVQIASRLVDLGIGTVVLRDSARIQEHDLGGALHRRHLGRGRAEVLAEALTAPQGGSVVIDCPPDGSVRGADLQIRIRSTCGAPGPTAGPLRPAVAESGRVLPVALGDQVAVLGPIIGGGAAVCLECLPNPSSMVKEDPATDTAATEHPATEPDPQALDAQTLQACAAIVGQQVGIMIGGEHQPALAQAVMRLDAVTGDLSSHAAARCAQCRGQTQSFEEPPSPSSALSPEPSPEASSALSPSTGSSPVEACPGPS